MNLLSEKIPVFVYGTLKKGYENHKYLERSGVKFIGEAKTVQKYVMYFNKYPYVSKDKAISHIHGELYFVDEKVLKDLDKLEGHPDWYRREIVQIRLENGKELEAYLYFNPFEKGHVISSGKF